MNKGLPAWLWGSIIVAIVIVVGFFDWLTGYEVDFLLFYFLPVSLAAWFLRTQCIISSGCYLRNCVGWSRRLVGARIFILLL